jgi:hypothetical protein
MSDEVTAPGQSPETAAPADAAQASADSTLLGAPQGETAQTEADKADAETPKEEGKDGEDENGEDGEKTEIKPEDYGDFTLPEGYVIDKKGMEQFKAFAAEKGWNKDMAQGVIDFAPQYEAIKQQQMMAAYQAQGEAWVQSVRADKEIGGVDLGAKIAVADRAVAQFGTPELRALLNPYHPEKNPTGTGLGNHPEIVRAFYRAGLTVTEPGPVNTTSPVLEAMSTTDFYAREVFTKS